MLVEIDEVAVDPGLWQKAKSGDAVAIDALRRQCDGMVLYLHALHTEANTIPVTVRELREVGVVRSITVHLE